MVDQWTQCSRTPLASGGRVRIHSTYHGGYGSVDFMMSSALVSEFCATTAKELVNATRLVLDNCQNAGTLSLDRSETVIVRGHVQVLPFRSNVGGALVSLLPEVSGLLVGTLLRMLYGSSYCKT